MNAILEALLRWLNNLIGPDPIPALFLFCPERKCGHGGADFDESLDGTCFCPLCRAVFDLGEAHYADGDAWVDRWM